MFYFLEEQNQLDPNNEVDLFCFHYVYLPRINFALRKFKDAWNKHKLSTEGGKTPNQLYILGMLRPFGSDYRSVRELFDENDVNDSFGVDIDDNPDNLETDSDQVVVPRININISESCLVELRELVYSTQMQTNSYIDSYIICKQI